MAALDFSSGGTLVPEKPLDFSQHGVPVDAPTPVSIMGPNAADAAAIAPLAKSDPNADSIGKALLGAQDVGATVASRYTPAAFIPQIAGGLAGLFSLPQGADAAADKVSQTEQALSYEPQTAAGKITAAPMDYLGQKIGQGADYVGQKTTDVTGSPALGAGVSTAAQLLPLLLGERAIRGGIDTARAVRAGDLSRGDQSIPASIDTDMHGITDRASLADTLMQGATDPQAPTPADGLKSMLDQVKTTIAQNLQQPPAPEKPRGRLNLQTGKVEPVATENANAANRPVAVQPDNRGAGTGVDSAPVSPEAAARAAALEEKPDAAQPLHPWTPTDTSASVPLAGGVSDEAGGPQVVIDKRIPQFVTVPDRNGKPVQIDAHEAIALHERTEHPIMHEDGADYSDAHDVATKAENAFVAQKYNVDPALYQKALTDAIAKAREEAPKEPGNIPENLDAKPYVDGGDEHLLTQEPVEQNVSQQPFTPEERHAAKLDAHLGRLGDLTPEQRQAVIDNHGNVEMDSVLDLPTRKDMIPSLKAAQESGQPAAYGEIDIQNVGGLNSHVGGTSKADPHLKAVGQIVNKHLQEAAKQSGGQAVLVRKGGDELGAITKGVDADTLHNALTNARAEVADYAKANNLESYPNPKKANKPEGLGINFGVAEVDKQRSIEDSISRADGLVEARKKGASYEQRGTDETARNGTPNERAGGSAAQGVVGARSEAGRVPRTGEGQGPSGSEPEAEVAVAEPETKAAKPPPTKPVEPAASAEPEKAEGTSPRNAAIDADRERYGLDDLEPAEREHWEKPLAEAQAKIAADPSYPEHLAREVAAKPRPLTTTEEAALTVDLKRLDDEHATATQAIVDAQSAGDTNAEVRARIQRQGVLDAIDRNHEALRKGGSESARSLAFRNAILKDDYSLGRNLNRAKAAYGDKFNPELQKKIEDLSAKLKEKDDLIAGMQRKKQVDANTRMQAKLTKDIADMEAKLAKRLKVCPL